MKKIMICTSIALGSLFASTAMAADTDANVSANIVFKIGSKTYNGTTSGVLNITPEPTPTPTPLANSHTFDATGSSLTDAQ